MIKDTSILFIGNSISAILGVIFTILAARFLGPEAWGLVAAVTSLIIILGSIADLGFNSSIFRFLSKEWAEVKNASPDIYKTIVFLRLISAILFGAVLVLLSKWITPLVLQQQDASFIALAAIGLIGVLFVDLQTATFQAKQSWVRAATFAALTNALRLILFLVLVATNLVSVLSVLAIFVVSLFITFTFSLLWQRLPIDLPQNWLLLSKKIFSFSIWLAGNQSVSSINSRIDVLLLLNIAGSINAGIYGAASRIALGFPIIIGSFATVLAPRFASIGSKNDLWIFFKKSIGLSILISSTLIVGILLAPFLILLLGTSYEGSVQVFRLLLISFIPFTLSAPPVNILIYRFNKPYVITVLSFVSLPVIIFGNIFFIPVIGILAPALILLFVNTLTMVVTYTFALHAFRKLT